jgi:hypothetical protein
MRSLKKIDHPQLKLRMVGNDSQSQPLGRERLNLESCVNSMTVAQYGFGRQGWLERRYQHDEQKAEPSWGLQVGDLPLHTATRKDHLPEECQVLRVLGAQVTQTK